MVFRRTGTGFQMINKGDGMEIGQEVYLEPLDNSRRYGQDIATEIISKIGKKFFQVEGWTKRRFHIDTMLHDGGDYSPQWQVYLSRQAIEDKQRISTLNEKISNLFTYSMSKLTLEQLEKIDLIVTPTTPRSTE